MPKLCNCCSDASPQVAVMQAARGSPAAAFNKCRKQLRAAYKAPRNIPARHTAKHKQTLNFGSAAAQTLKLSRP